jgi:hypothetical protein
MKKLVYQHPVSHTQNHAIRYSNPYPVDGRSHDY